MINQHLDCTSYIYKIESIIRLILELSAKKNCYPSQSDIAELWLKRIEKYRLKNGNFTVISELPDLQVWISKSECFKPLEFCRFGLLQTLNHYFNDFSDKSLVRIRSEELEEFMFENKHEISDDILALNDLYNFCCGIRLGAFTLSRELIESKEKYSAEKRRAAEVMNLRRRDDLRKKAEEWFPYWSTVYDQSKKVTLADRTTASEYGVDEKTISRARQNKWYRDGN